MPPKDFYSYALDRVRLALKNHPKEALNKITLNRKIIKKSVILYLIIFQLTGIGEHLMEHMIYFKEIETKNILEYLCLKKQ